MCVEVVQFDVEWRQAAEDREADAASSDNADFHALHVVGTRDTVGDVPSARSPIRATGQNSALARVSASRCVLRR